MTAGVPRRGLLRLAGAAAAGAALAGCGLSSGSALPLPVRPGRIRPVPELEGVTFTVGSKDYTEQVVLAYLAEFALSAAGARVRDLSNITGSSSARNALVGGQIDLMWEYTGVAWVNYNGNTEPIADPQEQYRAVRRQDRLRNDIAWTSPAFAVDNTYGFAVSAEAQRRLDVHELSDLPRIVRERPEEATFCVETEFASRNDGFPGVQRAYGFRADPQRVRTLYTGSIYQATANGTCTFGEVFTTDGRIRAMDLRVLVDDRSFFPRYNLAMTMRVPTFERYPQLSGLFGRISELLSNDELMRLNARVDVDGRDPADVAREWLAAKGLVRIP
ncbi:glycine betaine ABC transporter substrate-binding protein [Salinifilum aidingensis]